MSYIPLPLLLILLATFTAVLSLIFYRFWIRWSLKDRVTNIICAGMFGLMLAFGIEVFR